MSRFLARERNLWPSEKCFAMHAEKYDFSVILFKFKATFQTKAESDLCLPVNSKRRTLLNVDLARCDDDNDRLDRV
jgi:hypothetical protein